VGNWNIIQNVIEWFEFMNNYDGVFEQKNQKLLHKTAVVKYSSGDIFKILCMVFMFLYLFSKFVFHTIVDCDIYIAF